MIQNDNSTLNIANLRDIPTISVVVIKAISVINNPKSSAKQLTDLIINDQVLAARILKVANSAYYGLPNKVNNLNRAITLIGFNELKRLIMPLMLMDTFKSFKNNQYFSSNKFWAHSLAVASGSQIIAEKTQSTQDIGEARVVGLLHDIGRLIFVEYFPNEFERIAENISLGISTCKAENAIMGYDHCEAGGYVTELWNIPSSVAAAIRYHHNVENCPEQNRTLASIVAIADFMAYELGMPSLVNREKPQLPSGLLNQFVENDDELDMVMTKVEVEVEKSLALINFTNDSI